MKMRSKYFNALAALSVALMLCNAAAPASLAQTARASSASAAQSGDYYSCPMHPEVKSKKKGRCPKCKMELRLTHAEAEPAAAAIQSQAAHEDSNESTRASVSENAKPLQASAGYSKMTIPDVELLDQDGRKVHFYSDLVKGKTVAVNFIFTTCTTICPPLGATFARVQRELGERAGRDVYFISISVDPATDTPERLKAWGAKFHAGPGWTFVTGPKPQVDELLRALGAATASPADHSPTVLIGNDAAAQWTRTYGLASPATLLKIIDAAAAGRLDSSTDSNSKESARQ
jgi:cytochrome oxidase Cu insertion factor (SCO1/SenC/PrrC family)